MQPNTQLYKKSRCRLALHKLRFDLVDTTAEACVFGHRHFENATPNFSYGRVLVYRLLWTEILPDIRFIDSWKSSLNLLFQCRNVWNEPMLEPLVETIPASLDRVEFR